LYKYIETKNAVCVWNDGNAGPIPAGLGISVKYLIAMLSSEFASIPNKNLNEYFVSCFLSIMIGIAIQYTRLPAHVTAFHQFNIMRLKHCVFLKI